MKLDYAVVGGGVAGTYAAWRLATAKSGAARVGLFEHSDRIGGRLLSVRMPGMPNVRAELGGMRYIPDGHPMVAGLVEHLDLATKPFLMGNPNREDPTDPTSPVIGQSRNLYFLRGRHFIDSDFATPERIPYDLLPHERGLSPTQLQFLVMSLVGGTAEMSTQDWFELKVFGEPLYKFGYWNLLARMVSAEAYAFMTEAGGYVANTANANSVYQLPATEYGDATVTYSALRDGFQALPLTLEAQFRAAGGETLRTHALRRIERRKDGLHRLVFAPTRCERGRYRIDRAAPTVEVVAENVILAMPRRSLELIDLLCWADHHEVHRQVGSVLVQHAFKLALGYVSPWWRELGLYAGRSITDLPLRQTYYLESERDYGDDGNQSALLMASYNDISTVPFWRGLVHAEPFKGFETAFTRNDKAATAGGDPGATLAELPLPTTAPMVDTAQEQLALLHRLKAIPAPYTAAYHDWSDDPYGGGWHEWKAGRRYTDVIAAMLKPVEDQNVHVCGEAYSSDQGWVEGALDTAETMLETHLGLPRPDWAKDGWKPGG